MARPKFLMRDYTNLNRIYKAHRTNVWWIMKVFQIHCIWWHRSCRCGSTLVQAMACYLTKPLPEPMLAYHQMCCVAFIWEQFHKCPGGRFKNAYELLNLRTLKISMLYKSHIFQCMGKIFCVEFQRVPLKFHTKYLTHTLKDVDFIHIWKFKSS